METFLEFQNYTRKVRVLDIVMDRENSRAVRLDIIGDYSCVQVASVPKPLIAAGRGKFNVLSQAVTTTPETEAEAEASTTEASVGTLVPTEDAPPGTLKTKKLTKRVKHIMEVGAILETCVLFLEE